MYIFIICSDILFHRNSRHRMYNIYQLTSRSHNNLNRPRLPSSLKTADFIVILYETQSISVCFKRQKSCQINFWNGTGIQEIVVFLSVCAVGGGGRGRETNDSLGLCDENKLIPFHSVLVTKKKETQISWKKFVTNATKT